MEEYTLDKDVRVFAVQATSFPDGIMEAHERLHALVPFSEDRRFFGISRPDRGVIIYRAAAEESFTGEGDRLGCETIVIRKGPYLSLMISDYTKDPASVGRAFEKILSQPDIDPEGWCVEWYLKGKDVRCMVRIIR